MLLIDGLDEYRESEKEIIFKTILRSWYTEVVCFTTSCPEKVKLLQKGKAEAVEKHASLPGFSDEDVANYINKWYENQSNLAEGLYNYISVEKPQFLEIARAPIKLRMMCILWIDHRDFGNSEVDLYELMASYNLTHLEKKHVQDLPNITPKDKIIEKFHPQLHLLAKLAFTWSNSGELVLIFEEQFLKDTFGVDFQNTLDLGFLTCTHPKSSFSKIYWNFTHTTIQEYFAAYYLKYATKNDKGLAMFAYFCSSHVGISRNRTILNFLCGFAPDQANIIVQQIVSGFRGNDNVLLQDFLEKLAVKYKDPQTLKFPLPPKVVLSTAPSKCQLLLMKPDFKADENQGEELILYSPSSWEGLTECRFRKLNIALKMSENQNESQRSCGSLSKILGIQQLSLTIENPRYSFESLLSVIVTKNLSKLFLKGNMVIEAVNAFLDKCSCLSNLAVYDTRDTVPIDTLTAFFKQIKEKPNLSSVFNTCSSFEKEILAEVLSTNSLIPKCKNMSPTNLKSFASIAKELNSQNKVYVRGMIIADTDITKRGFAVSRLLIHLPSLQVFSLQYCKVKPETFETMFDVMDESGVYHTNIYVIDLSGTDLHEAGQSVGGITANTPNLKQLVLRRCNMNATDVADIGNGLEDNSKDQKCSITELDLSNNNLHEKIDTMARGFSEMPDLHKLHLCQIGAINDDTTLLFKNTNSVLKNLTFLDLSHNDCSETNFLNLADALRKFDKLSVVKMRSCACNKSNEVEKLILNLPENVKQLDMSQNNFSQGDMLLSDKCLHKISQLSSFTLQHTGLDTEQLRCILHYMNSNLQIHLDELPLPPNELTFGFDIQERLWLELN